MKYLSELMAGWTRQPLRWVDAGRTFARAVACLVLLLAGVGAAAQTIDSLDWVQAGDRVVARITFGANVRFLRQAPSALSDLLQVSFDLSAADDTSLSPAMQESKRLAARGPLPAVTLTYAPMTAARTKVLNLQFGKRVQVLAKQGPDAHTIDLEFVSIEGQVGSLAPLPAMAQETKDRQYAIVLQTSQAQDAGEAVRVPAMLQDYVVFSMPLPAPDQGKQALAVGYFKTQEEADVVRTRILSRFPDAKVLALNPPAAPVVASPSQPSAPPPSPASSLPPARAEAAEPPVHTDSAQHHPEAQDLLAQARKAMSEQRYRDAVDILNRALLLPPNPATQESQELIGFAWEGLRDFGRARIEYKLYQRLYPNTDGAQRIAERLETLGSGEVTAAVASADARGTSGFSYSGGISQYYYGGSSKSDSLVNISAGIDQNTLSQTNQSALVTSLDLTGRYRGETSETRLVLRGNSSSNFVATSKAQSSLNAAYVDYRNLNNRLGLRVGRQSAIAGSMFGLFDGVSVSMPVAGDFKLSGSVGVPANMLVSAPSQQLLGVMLEADNLFERWGGSLSLVDQRTEEISDRRALGMEVRYFGEGMSVFSQLDYDLNFEKINAFTLQGSMQGPMDTSITLLVDDRKAPSLQLSDALISSGATSLKTLLQLRSLAEVQDLALGTAAQARQAMLSVSRALSPKWQSSADIRYSEIGELPAVGNFQAMPATGAQYTFSMQLTGSNLYSSRDINGFNLSFLNSASAQGTQLSYNNLTGFLDNKAAVEFSLSLYTQTDNASTKVNRISPGVRLSYKLSERASIMGETIYEQSTTEGLTSHDNSSAYFFYVGYRYDLF
ncbi:MAG: hypothetical protein NTU86_12505 [Burkholderiales bacterium]|nr:hypothetical protein [Burkholderiales bacterium]